MPWVVGIDEAGYGPNLGPLVQAAVALHLPDGDVAGWETLKPVVRRCGEKADGRLLIDDSKKVYTRHGFEGLELGVWSTLGLILQSLRAFLDHAALPQCHHDLWSECWCDADEHLPLTIDATRLDEGVRQWLTANDLLRSGVWNGVSNIVPAKRFNEIVDASDSKAAVLAQGLVALMQANYSAGRVGALCYPDDPLVFLCDKMGGRNFYAGMLQEAFPTGWVIPEKESAAESRYRVEMLDRPVTVTFRPRADGDSVAVALASMLCKYLREVCMRQFNRFWATHVPGIAPTAGYPVDAKRFFAQIKPAMAKLGLTDDQVWRKK
jgi:hypothetical protein